MIDLFALLSPAVFSLRPSAYIIPSALRPPAGDSVTIDYHCFVSLIFLYRLGDSPICCVNSLVK